MARKTAAERAAEEQAAAEEAVAAEAKRVDRHRLTWAGAFLAAVLLFGAGYAIGNADDDTIVGSDTANAAQADTPAPGRPQARVPGQDRGPGIDRRSPGAPPVERDGRPNGRNQPQVDDQAPVFEPGYLGVGVRQTPAGVLVIEVRDGAPGDDAGIAVDDVIVSVDGVDTANVGDFARAIRGAGAGAEVEITVVRDGIESTVTALLVEIPA